MDKLADDRLRIGYIAIVDNGALVDLSRVTAVQGRLCGEAEENLRRQRSLDKAVED